MNKNVNNIGQSRWSNLIKVVKTPLGFYSFIAILIHLIFGIGVGFIPATSQAVFVFALPAILLILIFIVTFLAIFKPDALYGKEPHSKQIEEKIKTLEKNLKTLKDEIKSFRT